MLLTIWYEIIPRVPRRFQWWQSHVKMGTQITPPMQLEWSTLDDKNRVFYWARWKSADGDLERVGNCVFCWWLWSASPSSEPESEKSSSSSICSTSRRMFCTSDNRRRPSGRGAGTWGSMTRKGNISGIAISTGGDRSADAMELPCRRCLSSSSDSASRSLRTPKSRMASTPLIESFFPKFWWAGIVLVTS